MAKKRRPGPRRVSNAEIFDALTRAVSSGDADGRQSRERLDRLINQVAGLESQIAAMRMQIAGMGAVLAGLEAQRARQSQPIGQLRGTGTIP